MKIHHLNCATLCPRGARIVLGPSRTGEPPRMVCHCLLVETAAGLVLVDTGLGLADIDAPGVRLGRAFNWLVRPRLDPAETAIRQIEALGLSPSDVRHIVLTHLDPDHAGGLPDFPNAVVHVYGAELDAARAGATARERSRYRPPQWAHKPAWARYDTHGEPWFGFEAVRDLEGLPPEILLVPLLGHSHGHCGVAVAGDGGWLLHCGDAYFHHAEVDPDRPGCPPGLRLFQRAIEVDRRARLHNQRRLLKLARDHAAEVELFCAHDAYELHRQRTAAGGAAR